MHPAQSTASITSLILPCFFYSFLLLLFPFSLLLCFPFSPSLFFPYFPHLATFTFASTPRRPPLPSSHFRVSFGAPFFFFLSSALSCFSSTQFPRALSRFPHSVCPGPPSFLSDCPFFPLGFFPHLFQVLTDTPFRPQSHLPVANHCSILQSTTTSSSLVSPCPPPRPASTPHARITCASPHTVAAPIWQVDKPQVNNCPIVETPRL